MQELNVLPDKKQLVIIQYINHEMLNNLDSKDTDFLCVDIESMFKLKKYGKPFLSFYDFFSQEDFVGRFKHELCILKEVFKELDKNYAPFINYPYAFMGNYYIFFTYFADVLFISEAVAGIRNRYDKVFFYTSYKKNDLENYQQHKDINFFDPWSIFKYRESSIASLICENLNADLVYIESDDIEKTQKFNFYLSTLRNSNYSLLFNYLRNSFITKFSMKKSKKNKTIFSIDLNYEPKYIQPFMAEYDFVNPIELIQKGNLDKKGELPDILEIKSDSIRNMTSLRDDTFLDILKIYHRDVISYIPSFIDKINEKFIEFKPVCVFFSIGQVNIIENIAAFQSNKYRIPVFNFQHGDGYEFIPDIYEYNKYIELNEDIKKTLILRSKNQYDMLNKIKPANTGLFHGGNCKAFTYMHNLPDKKNKRPKKVLVIAGSYPAESYRNLTCVETEMKIFHKHDRMFNILKKYRLEVDVKLFPNNKHLYYFKEMLRYNDIHPGRIIAQTNVELLLPNYDLIIMEYIGSALTPILMTLKVPVVYWIDRNFINQNILDDFCEQHYLISNDVEFESMIKQFNDNKLGTKYNEELIKKYCFPSFTINPARIISDYIKSQISGS